MKKLLNIALLVLVPTLAFAQSGQVKVNGPHVSVEANGAGGNISLVPGTGGKAQMFGDISFPSTNGGVAEAINQVTPVAAGTVAAAGNLKIGINIIPTPVATAASFMALPAATAHVGKSVTVFSAQATAVPGNLYPQTTDVIYVNGAAVGAAGTPAVDANACNRDKTCVCSATGNTIWRCLVR